MFRSLKAAYGILFFSIAAGLPGSVDAVLKPGEVLVIANRKLNESQELADYYLKARNIPKKNYLELEISSDETITRKEYETNLVKPLRRFLTRKLKQNRIRFIVLIYGFPLRIAPEDPQKKITGIENDPCASLDSELSLVLVEDFPIDAWIPNPFFIGNLKKKQRIDKQKVIPVARIDGPSVEIAKRIIDDSLFAEKNGLKGNAYFDARWNEKNNVPKSDYLLYDEFIRESARQVEKIRQMPVILESTEALFQPGQCPNAALYCGWYSHAEYIDAFSWERGSVGYHIASSECRTLKKPFDNSWCKRMLEKGIAATIGPINEPYVESFPVPSIFFGFLTDGYLSLGESYLASNPFFSWKMILIGDPIYRPFKTQIDPKRPNP